MVSILTSPTCARHRIEVMDDDVTVAIPHLKLMIDETLDELSRA